MSDMTAIEMLKQYQGEGNALVLVNENDLNTQRMFVPVVTKIPVTRADFHDKPINGRMMPRGHHVDRIGEAAGVEFVHGDAERLDGEVVGIAQGRRRMPDGSWRTSSVQRYGFNWGDRAEEDFLNTPDKYQSEISKRRHLLELKKVAEQRAATGARLRVIRELVGIPIAFSKEDFQRALVVSRIALNTDEMLKDPGMREAAVAHAVGAEASLYGPRERDVSPKQVRIEAPDEADDDDDWPDDEPVVGEEKRKRWQAIIDYAEGYNLPGKAKEKISALEPLLATADIAAFDDLLARLKSWTEKNPGAQR